MKIKTLPNSLITAAYMVPGHPHPLLAADKSPAWQSLNQSFAKVREEIANSDAEMILYFSSQWLSVLGYLFQADPNPEFVLVDHNWHELGSMPYRFKVDVEFVKHYRDQVSEMGHYTRLVNYKGFPIDTGVVVAQKLLNPDNRLPAAMVSCNMYAEKQETLSIGQAGARALEKHGKKCVAVVVSSLSSRYEVREIDPKLDKVSSQKDDEWNRKVLDLFAEGRVEDVSEVAREFSRQANADMGFKGLWWLNGLCGKVNSFSGKVFDYQPVWGTGAGIVGLYPTSPIRPVKGWANDEADLVERFGARSKGQGGLESALGSFSETPPAYQQQSTDDDETAKRSNPIEAREVKAVHSQKAPEPVGPYPHARRVGDFLFLSGLGPRARGQKEIPGVIYDSKGQITGRDIEKQTRSVIENIRTVLEEAGSSLSQVVDVQVFLTNMKEDFQTFNKVYGEYFAAIGPTRTTVEVESLPTPIAVELKVIAYVGKA